MHLAGTRRHPCRLVVGNPLMYDGRRADKLEIHMPSKAFTSLLAGLIIATAVPLRAQTLGDVARKEEERRKAIPSGKVYTNQDLKAVPPSLETPAGADADKGAASDKASEPEKDQAAGKGDAADKKDKADGKDAKAADGAVKDQKYWHDRMNAARLALERDSGYAEAMQTRINALTTDFVNRDDPAQRGRIEQDRVKALSELERLRKQIEDDKKAISDLEDEARRAGVPPGWLR